MRFGFVIPHADAREAAEAVTLGEAVARTRVRKTLGNVGPVALAQVRETVAVLLGM